MTSHITLEQIDELAKCKYLKQTFAGLLFKHHPENNSTASSSLIDAMKAAEEFLRIFYPFGAIANPALSLYIANKWPQDPVVMEQYLIYKETQAQGFFLPNKSLLATKIIEIMDSIKDTVSNYPKNSKDRKKLRSLQNDFHDASDLLKSIMNYKYNMDKRYE